jgi:ArsR family transcriptional regulator
MRLSHRSPATAEALDPLSDGQFVAIARALADPRRFAILTEIAEAELPLTCCGLKEARHVSAATISHHIRELEAAGLIDIGREGKFAQLSFRRENYDAFLRRLGRLGAPAQPDDRPCNN